MSIKMDKMNKPKKKEWSDLGNFKDDEWIAEPKFDGERCTMHAEELGGGKTDTRVMKEYKNKTAMYPELHNIELPGNSVIDGEVCVYTSDLTSNFNNFQRRMNLQDTVKISQYIKQPEYTVTFVAFDILQYNDKDVSGLSFGERRKLLDTIPDSDRFKKVTQYKPEDLASLVTPNNMEGMVIKNTNDSYHNNWYKIKNLIEKDFLITGYTTSDKRFISTIEIELDGNPMGSVTYFGPKFPQTEEAARKLKGSTAVVQYMSSGAVGKPRFPVLKEIR